MQNKYESLDPGSQRRQAWFDREAVYEKRSLEARGGVAPILCGYTLSITATSYMVYRLQN